MSNDDQFKMSRLPLRILPYKDKELAQGREILIDYEGDNPSYNIYIVDAQDRTKIINITDKIIQEAFPGINADNLQVTIDGILNSLKLKDVINDIYKKFVFPEDDTGFVYSEDIEKVFDKDTLNVLLTDKGDNVYLPVTIAGNVYDSTGQTIQARLDSLTRLGFATTFARATTNNQVSFEIDYPFLNYPTQGNYMEVRIGSTFIDKSRYEIVDHTNADGDIDKCTLNLLDEYLENGRAINILFIFNASTTTGGKFEYTSGAFIANGSLPACKLEKISNRYDLADSSSVASSKAVSNLYDELMNTINNYSPNCIYTVDTNKSTSAGAILIVNNNEFTVKDACKVCVRTINKTKPGLKIQLNGKLYQIYSGDQEIDYEIAAGKIINLTYSMAEKRFYIQSLYNYKLKTNRWIYTAKDQEIIIPFNGLYYNYGDQIFVFKNGVRLFEFVDYTIDYGEEAITLYVRTEEEDKFIFESYTVERR